jgi:hypothetical protein
VTTDAGAAPPPLEPSEPSRTAPAEGTSREQEVSAGGGAAAGTSVAFSDVPLRLSADRFEAIFLGALAGERAAQAPAAAGDLLEVADSIASVGGFDAADLQGRGLTGSSQAGSPGLLLRAVPFGLLTPGDRPRIRRDAYRVATLANADEATAIAAIAAALLAADLSRFDPATALLRVHQSLLEDAPLSLLERLRWRVEELPPLDDDPGVALQIAMHALRDAGSIEAAVHAAAAPGRRAALSLAGALAGAWLGAAGVDEPVHDLLSHAQRATAIAAAFAARAVEVGAPQPR